MKLFDILFKKESLNKEKEGFLNQLEELDKLLNLYEDILSKIENIPITVCANQYYIKKEIKSGIDFIESSIKSELYNEYNSFKKIM